MKKLFLVSMISVLFFACNSGGGTVNTNSNNANDNNPQAEVPATPTTGSILLHNDSSVEIDGLYVALSSAPTWGDNRLVAPLAAGLDISVADLEPDNYDVAVVVNTVDSSYFGYLFNESISAGQIQNVIANDTSFSGSLKISNDSSGGETADITGVYLRVSGTLDWGTNQISSNIVSSGSEQIVGIPADDYEIKITWGVGHTAPETTIAGVTSIASLNLSIVSAN